MIAALFLLQAAAPAPVAAPTPAPWAIVQSGGDSAATSTSAWSRDRKARLVIRCDTKSEKIVSIQFIPKPGFAAASARPVSIKADDGGWLGTNWQFPGNGAFISDDVIVTNLAVVIAGGKTIRVRVIDPDNAALDAEFAGPGETPVRRVLAACAYDFGKAPPRSLAHVPASPTAAAASKPDPDADQ